MVRKLSLVLCGIGLLATIAPARAATAHHQIKKYVMSNVPVTAVNADVGNTNLGKENPNDEADFFTESAAELAGEDDPNPGKGTALDDEPLAGSPADKRIFDDTAAEGGYYGGASFDLPATATNVKITFVDDAAGTAGVPIPWDACAIHGSNCDTADTSFSGCTNSNTQTTLPGFAGAREVAVWVFMNDSGGLWTDGCDGLALEGTIRIDYLS